MNLILFLPGVFNPDEDSICGGFKFPDDNYETNDELGLDDGFGSRRKRNAANPGDTLPHIDNAHYRYHHYHEIHSLAFMNITLL